jgi:predicted CXXCH cytochrome family protein
MIAVQCESCHGPGRAHTTDPDSVALQSAGESYCRRCHDLQNSPGFVFKNFWNTIIH